MNRLLNIHSLRLLAGERFGVEYLYAQSSQPMPAAPSADDGEDEAGDEGPPDLDDEDGDVGFVDPTVVWRPDGAADTELAGPSSPPSPPSPPYPSPSTRRPVKQMVMANVVRIIKSQTSMLSQ